MTTPDELHGSSGEQRRHVGAVGAEPQPLDQQRECEKVDERGRSIDIHALRHTFGTHLSKSGVAPRTAQALMRHSDIDLTMNVYTDPTLLDRHGAVNSLPTMNSNANPTKRERQKATGTDDVLPIESRKRATSTSSRGGQRAIGCS